MRQNTKYYITAVHVGEFSFPEQSFLQNMTMRGFSKRSL